jgi:hypothetical protein
VGGGGGKGGASLHEMTSGRRTEEINSRAPRSAQATRRLVHLAGRQSPGLPCQVSSRLVQSDSSDGRHSPETHTP